MKTPRPLPDPFAHAPFTFLEALDAGASYRRLRHRGLASPSRGIRIPCAVEPPPDLGPMVRPYTRVTEFTAASHATAFRLWEMPGFLPGADGPGIHLSRPDTMAIPRRTGVIGHVGQFFPDEITSIGGLLVTTRTRTWLDVSRLMAVDELTVVADHLIRVPRPDLEGRTEAHASVADLAEMLDRHKGTPGIRKARLALEQARVGSDSAPETRLRLALTRAGLPEPEVNPRTELLNGVVRQPDLAYPEFLLAVEYEGDGHSEAGQVIRDITREEDFGRGGWTLVRLSKRHMANDARSAVSKVHDALLARGWRPR
jgi:very-short-patch-repair endonuclease